MLLLLTEKIKITVGNGKVKKALIVDKLNSNKTIKPKQNFELSLEINYLFLLLPEWPDGKIIFQYLAFYNNENLPKTRWTPLRIAKDLILPNLVTLADSNCNFSLNPPLLLWNSFHCFEISATKAVFYTLFNIKTLFLGGSPGLEVMGDDSWLRGRGFKSQHRILDGNDIFHIDLR